MIRTYQTVLLENIQVIFVKELHLVHDFEWTLQTSSVDHFLKSLSVATDGIITNLLERLHRDDRTAFFRECP